MKKGGKADNKKVKCVVTLKSMKQAPHCIEWLMVRLAKTVVKDKCKLPSRLWIPSYYDD